MSKLLEDDAALVRLVAVRHLVRRAAEWADGKVDHLAVRDQLLKAATSKHPSKMKIEIAKNHRTTLNVNETKNIQTAAAAALVDFVLPADKTGALIKAVRRGDDEQLIAKAIAKWAHEDARKELEAAAGDDRQVVADAAKAALEKLGGQ